MPIDFYLLYDFIMIDCYVSPGAGNKMEIMTHKALKRSRNYIHTVTEKN